MEVAHISSRAGYLKVRKNTRDDAKSRMSVIEHCRNGEPMDDAVCAANGVLYTLHDGPGVRFGRHI